MLKKMLLSLLLLSVLSAAESTKAIDIRYDIDKLAWMAYKVNKFNPDRHQDGIKNWLIRAYHAGEYARIKSDQFALDDAKEKYYSEFITKMNSMKNTKNTDYLKIDVILHATGKIQKYDFKRKAFLITPEPKYGIQPTQSKKSYTFRGTDSDKRKFIRNVSFRIDPHYLKMAKEDAKKLLEKYKNKTVLLEYKASETYIRLLGGNPPKYGERWFDLRGSFHKSQVRITDQETKELIGIGSI